MKQKKKKKKNTGIFKTIIGPTLYFQSLNDWWSRTPGTFLKRINFTFISPLCREIIPMDGLIAQAVLFLCVPKCVSYQLISVKVWFFFFVSLFCLAENHLCAWSIWWNKVLVPLGYVLYCAEFQFENTLSKNIRFLLATIKKCFIACSIVSK